MMFLLCIPFTLLLLFRGQGAGGQQPAEQFLHYTAPTRRLDFTPTRRIPDFTSKDRKPDYRAPRDGR